VTWLRDNSGSKTASLRAYRQNLRAALAELRGERDAAGSSRSAARLPSEGGVPAQPPPGIPIPPINFYRGVILAWSAAWTSGRAAPRRRWFRGPSGAGAQVCDGAGDDRRRRTA